MTNPDLFIFGIRIAEPITSITDLLAASIAFTAYALLGESRRPLTREKEFFRRYFLFLAVATTASGLFGHAFRYVVPDVFRILGWNLSALAVFSAQLGSNEGFERYIPEAFGRSFRILPWIQLFVTTWFVWRLRRFGVITMNTVVGLLGYVMPVQIAIFRRTGSVYRKRVATAIVLGLVPAAIFTYQIGVGPWLTHRDLSHLAVAAIIGYMFYGVQNLDLNEDEAVEPERAPQRCGVGRS